MSDTPRLILPLILALWLAGWSAGLAQAQQDRLIRLDGQGFSGKLTAIEPDGRVQWSDSAAGALDLMGLRRIERPIPNVTSIKEGIALFQQGGGIWRLQSLTYQDQSLEATWSQGKLLVPLPQVRGILLAGDPAQPDPMFTQALQASDQNQDLLLVKTDKGLQSVSGVVKAIETRQVTMLWNDQVRQVAREKVYGLVLASVNAPSVASGVCKVAIKDGSMLRAIVKQMIADRLILQWPSSQGTFEVPWDQVVRLEVISDRLVYLSDMEPVQVVQEALLSYPWPWQRDRTVLGKPIQWGDKSFEKGLGVHARNVLTFQVPASFDLLAATVGLLPPEAGKGDCEFVVSGDGRELFRLRVKGKDEPRPIQVNVAGVKRLSLAVESGEDFDLSDHAVWADARLLREKR